MSLNSSGPISLGGSVAGQSIALELNRNPTQQISLNDSVVRAFANVTTSLSSITIPNDFWGKSGTAGWLSQVYANLGTAEYNTYLFDTKSDNGGNIYLLGYQGGAGGSYGDFLAKQNSAGYIVWQTRFDGAISNLGDPPSLTLSNDGYIYFFGGISYETTLCKFNTSGVFQFANTINFPIGSNIRDVTTDTSNNLCIVVGTWLTPRTNTTIYKISNTGQILWNRTLGWIGNANTIDPYSVSTDSSGNFYVCGVNKSKLIGANYEGFLAKYNTNGTLQWQRSIRDTTYNTTCQYIKTSPSGNCYISTTTTGGVYVLCKYDTNGTLLWQRNFNIFGITQRLSLDIDENVYLALSDKILKYDKNGLLQWGRQLSSGVGGTTLVGINVDSLNNKFNVCGYFNYFSNYITYPSFTTYNYYTSQVIASSYNFLTNGTLTGSYSTTTTNLPSDVSYAAYGHADSSGTLSNTVLTLTDSNLGNTITTTTPGIGNPGRSYSVYGITFT
jgi:hypothetical protein